VRREVARAALAGLLLAGAASAGWRSVARVRAVRREAATCEAVAAQDWAGALAVSAGIDASRPRDRGSVECRCRALEALGRGAECVDLFPGGGALPATDGWLPATDVLFLLVEMLQARGEDAAAADLARRGAQAHPESKSLLWLEWQTRRAVEPEQQILADLAQRIATTANAAPELRLLVARVQADEGRFDQAADLLDPAPPAGSPAESAWFALRMEVQAGLGDPEGVRGFADQWRERGASRDLVEANYAVALANNQLVAPEGSTLELLRAIVARGTDPLDPALERSVYVHLVYQLVEANAYDEALGVIGAAPARVDFGGFSADQVAAARYGDAFLGQPTSEGTLSFHAPPGSLLLSPGASAPPDGPYQRLQIPASGEVEVTLATWYLPYRWVLRDPADRAVASGATWVQAARDTEVEITAGTPAAPQTWTRRPRPGDGRHRVWVLVHDCMDWRLLSYLGARGELPVLASMLRGGHHAVLESDPPYTAAAIDLLVHPHRPQPPTLLGFAYRMGVEVADLTPSGQNPFSPLEALIVQPAGLMETIASGDRKAANLLFSHGAMEAGRNGEVLGPRGQEQPPLAFSPRRPLRPEEIGAIPAPLPEVPERDLAWIEAAAAVMDEAVAQAQGRDLDLLLVRLATLDTATHAYLADVFGGQDDGAGLLLWFYRYLDLRTGEVLDALDEDDHLIVMSDHGIRNAMEHDQPALFVVVGPDVPVGAAAGTPHIAGVPRVIAALLGVQTDWPDTGVAPWVAPAGARP
jgi:hypothetical protein